MGVIFDYFRAPDAKAATQAMDRQGGPLHPEPAFDGVDTKWIDPQVILGSLVAFIRGTPYTLEMVRTKGVWPPPESAPQNEEEYEALPDDSPWKEGPFLEELDVETRDALASVNDGRIPVLAAQWAQIEEFHNGADPEDMQLLIQELVGLARRARNSGDLLYCWSIL